MDSLIAVLPAHVVDQIAAGEVIERPASVVKELVDNAIDAGGQTISVETQAGGRALIRVVDDGRGMNPRDAVLAFERHATSKLRAVDELWSLATMGFRGEALPSIASVSRVTLTTRQQSDLAATRVQIEGGRLIGVTEVGAPVGTTVEVADLLYNVPARLKFLKGETTEATHITDFISKIALAYPQLHLRLRHSGRVSLDTPPDRDGFARVHALLGARVASRMIAVAGQEAGIRVVAYLAAPELAQTTARGVQLFVSRRPIRDRGLLHAIAMGYGELVPRGRYPVAIVFVDAPAGSVDFNVHPQKQEVRFADPGAVAAAVRHVVQTGIARAPWRDEIGGAGPVMMSAIASVAPPRLPLDAPATQLAAQYSRELREMRERPQAMFGFDTASRQWAQQIKDRVRTSRAAEAEEAARDAAALARAEGEHLYRRTADGRFVRDEGSEHNLYNVAPESHEANASSGELFARGSLAAAREPARGNDGELFTRASAHAAPGDGVDGAQFSVASDGELYTRTAAGTFVRVDVRSDDATAIRTNALDHGVASSSPSGDAAPWDEAQLADGSGPRATPTFFSSLRYLGQLDLTYLMCEGDGELVLIDQHVAHERVELARLRKGHEERAIATQRLLFPTTIEVSPALVEVATRMSDMLAQVGYEAEPFGKTSLAVKSVPGALRHGDPTHLLRKLLGEWAEDGAPSEAERLDRVLAEIACHSVVRAGDRLSPSEAEALLRSMDSADFVGPGPHNRPVMLRMSLSDIARRFGR